MNLKVRLALMNFLQFGVWGAYLTCMGIYLSNIGMASHIGPFFAMQGIVSIFMPALMGIVADRWIPAQRLLGFCHFLAGLFMSAAAWYGHTQGNSAEFSILFTFYSLSVAFYMPTLALSNSVAYNALTRAGLDTVKDFPPIRVFGTIGFICSMWFVDIMGFKANEIQFVVSAAISFILFFYTFTLPACPASEKKEHKTFVDVLGLQAFTLFKQKKMAIFFLFSMLLGVSLQITNGFATPFIESFASISEYANTFGVQHSVILYSISQISETLCIYGVAFDFFNISGSLFVDQSTDPTMRSSAQGLFMLMTNGLGATIGSFAAQAVVDFHTDAAGAVAWQSCWYVFAAYALGVGFSFAVVFRPKYINSEKK